jgi:hypothetical protein
MKKMVSVGTAFVSKMQFILMLQQSFSLAERSGLKLGLGDFVFYSVLIARAAMYDWITTICCTIAVLMGLTATIFLLVLWKKALPALPISIAFGIMFYFVAKAVLVPYVGTLCVFGMVAI